MNAASRDRLIELLGEAKQYLARPGNDFVWSSWENEAAAQSELDGIISGLLSSTPPDRLEIDVLFAATGDIQEVSLSSGWGHEFIALSIRMDAALDRAYGRRPEVLAAQKAEIQEYTRQLFGGSLRWFCTILAPLAAGFVCYMLWSGDQPNVYFPLHLEGRGTLWAMIVAAVVFGVLGLINWISWSRRGRKVSPRNLKAR